MVNLLGRSNDTDERCLHRRGYAEELCQRVCCTITDPDVAACVDCDAIDAADAGVRAEASRWRERLAGSSGLCASEFDQRVAEVVAHPDVAVAIDGNAGWMVEAACSISLGDDLAAGIDLRESEEELVTQTLSL